MTPEEVRRARRSLLDRWHAARDRYTAEVHDEAELTSLREADPDDLAADQTAAMVLNTLAYADARELEAIVNALRRLRAGVYGRCIVCGEAIASARLEALPEAVLCQPCASEREG